MEDKKIQGKRDHISASEDGAEPTPHVHDRSRSKRIAAAPATTAAAPVPAPAHTRRVASLAQSLLMRSRRAEVDRPIPANQRPSTCPPILALNARDSAGPPNRGKQKPRGRRGAARPSSDARPLPSTNAHARTYVDVVTSEQTVLDLSS